MKGARSITASHFPTKLPGGGGEKEFGLRWWCFLAALAAALVPFSSALVSEPEPPKLTSLALIPHHEQVRRRKLEYARLNRTWLEEDISSGTHRNPYRRTKAQVVGAMYQSTGLDIGYGTHYVDLWCGTPTPRRQTVLVSGGSITAFPCMGCANCGNDGHHTDALYNQRTSTSFHALNCTECSQGKCVEPDDKECWVGVEPTEVDSWLAFEAVDICYLGGPHDSPLAVFTSAALKSTPPSSSKDVADPGVAGLHVLKPNVDTV